MTEYRRRATSNKTRIETRNCNVLSSANIVAEQLPIKQGLKLLNHLIDAMKMFVAEQLPIKQGLKQ